MMTRVTLVDFPCPGMTWHYAQMHGSLRWPDMATSAAFAVPSAPAGVNHPQSQPAEAATHQQPELTRAETLPQPGLTPAGAPPQPGLTPAGTPPQPSFASPEAPPQPPFAVGGPDKIAFFAIGAADGEHRGVRGVAPPENYCHHGRNTARAGRYHS